MLLLKIAVGFLKMKHVQVSRWYFIASPHTDVIQLDILDRFVFEVDTLFHNFEIPMFVISFDDVFVLKQ